MSKFKKNPTNKEFRTAKQVKIERVQAVKKLISENKPLTHMTRWVPGAFRGIPYNVATGKSYNGYNIFNLYMSAQERGFSDMRFISEKQIKKLGGSIQPEHYNKGFEVLYTDFIEKPELDDNDKPVLDDKGQPVIKRIPFLKMHYVYNAEQVNGLPPYTPQTFEHTEDGLKDLMVKAIKDMGIGYYENTTKCFYSPSKDYISMAKPELFQHHHGFEVTLAHEWAHSTGHTSRLNRDFSGRMRGDAPTVAKYAREEVIAEMAASMLSGCLGLEFTSVISDTHGNSVDEHNNYIASWAQHIDDRQFEEAMNESVKALNLMCQHLGIQHEPLLKESYTPSVGDDVIFSGPNKNFATGKFELRSVMGKVESVIHDKDGGIVGYKLAPLDFDMTEGEGVQGYTSQERLHELAYYLHTYMGIDAPRKYSEFKVFCPDIAAFFKENGYDIDKLKIDLDQSLNHLAYRFTQGSDMVDDTFEMDMMENMTAYKIHLAHQLHGNLGFTDYPVAPTYKEAVHYWSTRSIDDALKGVHINYGLDSHEMADSVCDSRQWTRQVHVFRPEPFVAMSEWGRFDPLDSMAWMATFDIEKDAYQLQLTARGVPVHCGHLNPIPGIEKYLHDFRETLMREKVVEPHQLDHLTLPINATGWDITDIHGQVPAVHEQARLHMMRHPWYGFGDSNNVIYKATMVKQLHDLYGPTHTGSIPAMDLKDTIQFWSTHSVGLDGVLMNVMKDMLMEGMGPDQFVTLARMSRKTPKEAAIEVGKHLKLDLVARKAAIDKVKPADTKPKADKPKTTKPRTAPKKTTPEIQELHDDGPSM